jgi:RNA polymerase sigma-70 factor (ECF subfamily)
MGQGRAPPNVTGDRLSEHRGDASDEALMARFQGGDRAAFALLVRRHQTPLYNFALRHVASAGAAEEIVQDAFLRVVQNASDFRRTSRFTAWLYTIARNLCIDTLRKKAQRKHRSLDEPSSPSGAHGEGPTLGERTADGTPGVERSALSLEMRSRLLSAIDQLSDEQREVFLLREISNLPFKDIAKVVDAPENTVKSRMRYALEHLQAALSDYEEYARALR